MVRCFTLCAIWLLFATTTRAGDWTQFRGPDRSGISTAAPPPVRWSESENLLWKADLPGPGSSSPIVSGDRVFVTCYSGYGVGKDAAGQPSALERHLVCVNCADGAIRWQRTIPGELPEDRYQGYLTEHGYASSTPAADGERVFAFFGKSGVIAYDLDGELLWRVSVGKESGNRRWGSGASLVVSSEALFVNASEESQTIYALDKATGKQLWKSAASALELAYGTPALVTLPEGRTDLVIAVPGEVWGLNAQTGKLRWFAEHSLTGNVCPSVVTDGATMYLFGGFQSSGSLAVRVGGEGNVGKSHVKWTSRNSSYVATPLLHDKHLYWVDDRGQAFCIEAETGKPVYRERVSDLDTRGRPVYASPVLAGGKLYVPTRWNGVLVLAASPKYEELARNQFASDDSEFNGTPAAGDGVLFLRSNRRLYCVGSRP
ncbi:MAG: PQQ-binding-like beta-propeller repeat protein [Planctomycetota bacterium]|nr:PQQ-binding-like beta-propeller repeat protein [Planctomycetota bacterium]